MNRGQIALEYVLVMSFAFILMMGYLYVVADAQNRSIQKAEQAEVERIAGILQSEIIVATQVKNGYNRTFWIPDSIRELPYTIQPGNGSIIVRKGQQTAYKITPPYSGVPVPGTNTIAKKNVTVRIN